MMSHNPEEKPVEGLLADEELDSVAGGGCGEGKNEATWTDSSVYCSTCGREMPAQSVWLYTTNADGTIMCESCESGQIQGDIASAYARVEERNQ